jgi:type I restriction enzyme M protein
VLIGADAENLRTTVWVQLADLILLRGAAAGDTPAPTLRGISMAGQLIPHSGRYPASTRRYRKVEVGDLAYNPSRIDSGALAHCQQTSQEGWVSPEYVVFRLTDNAPFGPAYLRAFLRSHAGRTGIAHQVYGSVRLRLPFTRLRAIQVPVPEHPDQWEQALRGVEELEQVATSAWDDANPDPWRHQDPE